MSDNRMLDDAELDAVSAAGRDGLLIPVLINALNKVFGTNLPGGTIDPPPAPCHPK
jgi:hypothetical protein